MSSSRPAGYFSEWKRGWPVAMAASIGFAMSMVHSYALGVFIQPLEAEFGWSRADISFGSFLVGVTSIACMPVVGWMMDRMDIRKIAVPGMAAFVLSVGALGFTGPEVWTWHLVFGLIAITHAFVNTAIWALGVATWFQKSRGLALSVALAGSGLCQAAAPPIANAFLTEWGWRAGFFGLAGIGLLLVTPLLFFCFKDGRRDRAAGAPAGEAPKPVVRAPVDGPTARDALKSMRFWRLAIVCVLVTVGISPLIQQFIPAITEGGLPRDQAVWLATLIGLSTIAGRLSAGLLLDRFHASVVGCIAFGAPVLVCLMLLGFDGSLMMAIPIPILLGLSNGAEIEVVAYMTARYFGLKTYGFLLSILTGLLAFGGSLGPFLAGVLHDQTGSYHLFFGILAATFAVSTLLIVTMGRYPEQKTQIA